MADVMYKNLETPSPEGRQTGNIKTKRGVTARKEEQEGNSPQVKQKRYRGGWATLIYDLMNEIF